jgi:O-antigen ligase
MAFVASLAGRGTKTIAPFVCGGIGGICRFRPALLGADFRKGEWPSDVLRRRRQRSNYLVTVGPVLTLTVALFTRRHSSKWLALSVLSWRLPWYPLNVLCGRRSVAGRIGVRLALASRAVAVGPVRLVLTGTILLALIGAGIYVSEQYRTGGDPESPLTMGKDLRPRVWKKVGEEILAHPLTGAGFGLGVMSKAYPALLSAGGEVFWHPHNLVLTYGISAGVPGMVAVLTLFAALAWRFWQLALGGGRFARLTSRSVASDLRAYSLGI